jgi:hypothetical protein
MTLGGSLYTSLRLGASFPVSALDLLEQGLNRPLFGVGGKAVAVVTGDMRSVHPSSFQYALLSSCLHAILLIRIPLIRLFLFLHSVRTNLERFEGRCIYNTLLSWPEAAQHASALTTYNRTR